MIDIPLALFTQWQDALITVGAVILALALLPSVFSENKPALQTSLLTGTVLVSFSLAYFTLNLWFATATTFLTAILWYVLAFQVWQQQKENRG